MAAHIQCLGLCGKDGYHRSGYQKHTQHKIETGHKKAERGDGEDEAQALQPEGQSGGGADEEGDRKEETDGSWQQRLLPVQQVSKDYAGHKWYNAGEA